MSKEAGDMQQDYSSSRSSSDDQNQKQETGKKASDQDKMLGKRKQMHSSSIRDSEKSSNQPLQMLDRKKIDDKHNRKLEKNQKYNDSSSESSQSEKERYRGPVKPREEDQSLQKQKHKFLEMLQAKQENEEDIQKPKPTERYKQFKKLFKANKDARLFTFQTRFQGSPKKATCKIKIRLNFGFYDQIQSTLMSLVRDKETKLIIQLTRVKDAYQQVRAFLRCCRTDAVDKITDLELGEDAENDEGNEDLVIDKLKSEISYLDELEMTLSFQSKKDLKQKRSFQVEGEFVDFDDDQPTR
ncbi:hypothetical protein OXYTRIMIC_440 [Oxytricha trifallax]|uniref:Uncharacterized protein n=1 Tax=Oxytricha trifallax TaxID=1172189 RepID=A0A073HX63_9SPIT|nr:hypothetical protein OXYTRIMIC_440 [Oxytricha trifallax]